MGSLYSASMEVLTVIVGPVPAQLCLVNASSLLGKEAEALAPDDYDAIAERIRSDLSAFTSEELIAIALSEIRARL